MVCMSNLVKWTFQKREAVSYFEMERKQVFRFNILMQHYYNAIEDNEEQNPPAMTGWPEDCLLLLKKLKKCIKEKVPGLDIQNFLHHSHQDLIYKSPGSLQQMVVARYSVWLQTENRNALQEITSRSQMLEWDCRKPPMWSFTSGSDWHIISMEVFVEKMDIGRQHLDSKNMVHLKVFLNIGRMTRPPTSANNIDPDINTCNINFPTYNNGLNPGFNPCFSKYCGVNTLTPEESNQLERLISRALKLKYLEDSSIITRDPTKYNRDTKHVGHWKPKKGFSAKTFIIASMCCLALFCPNTAASSVTGHQLKFEVSYDSENHNNCTLEANGCFICIGKCSQGKEDTNKCKMIYSEVEKVCKSQENAMETNILSSITLHGIPSGTLQLTLLCKFDEGFNLTLESVKYKLYGKNGNNIEIANPPMPVLKDHNLCETLKNNLYPFLNKSDQIATDATAPSATNATAPLATDATKLILGITFGIIITAIIITAIVIIVCNNLKYYGKKSCKNNQETCCKMTYSAASQSAANDNAKNMQVEETDNCMV